MTKFCVDCVHSTLIYPEGGAKFYQCGNPAYALINVVDKRKTYLECSLLRETLMVDARPWCGPSARGFLPIIPDIDHNKSPPRRTRWQIFKWEIWSQWRQRKFWLDGTLRRKYMNGAIARIYRRIRDA